jgi:Predicted membrane protein
MPGTDYFTGWHILMGLAGFLGTLLVIALITALVIFFVRRGKGRPQPPAAHFGPMPPALQLLDERLARGEIEIEDYLNRKAAMIGAPAQAAEPTAWPESGQDPTRVMSADTDAAGPSSSAQG